MTLRADHSFTADEPVRSGRWARIDDFTVVVGPIDFHAATRAGALQLIETCNETLSRCDDPDEWSYTSIWRKVR